jgi:hypothetical protein
MRWGKGVEVEGTGAFAVGLKLRSFGLPRTPQDDNGFFCGLTNASGSTKESGLMIERSAKNAEGSQLTEKRAQPVAPLYFLFQYVADEQTLLGGDGD